MHSITPSASVVPLFATPFGVVRLPEVQARNRELASLFIAGEAAERSADPRIGAAGGHDRLCYRSRDDLLDWPQEPVRILKAELSQAVRAVAASVTGLPEGALRPLTMQARGWFTIIHPDGCVPATSHPLTSWCCIYCVDAPGPSEKRSDSGALRLYESRLGTSFTDATLGGMRVPFALGHYTWRPTAGMLAVFPGWHKYEIALNRTPHPVILVTARCRFVAPGQEGVSRW